MKLGDLITADRVVVDVQVGDKAHLMADLAKRAAAALGIDMKAVLTALMARERLGSTGFGRGFALPHARIPDLDRFFALFVRLAKPVDFEAIDGAPVDLVCLLLIPYAAGNEHVAALAAIARRMRDVDFLQALRKPGNAGYIHDLLISGLETSAPDEAGEPTRRG